MRKKQKNIEQKFAHIGFQKVQDKEDCAFWEKNFEVRPNEFHQTCIIWVNREQRIKSIDQYYVTENGMEFLNVPPYREIVKQLIG
jgi:cobyrinic acid a,c-diamide synthase